MPFEFISFVWWRWLVECVHGKITQSHRTESLKPTYYKTCQTCTRTNYQHNLSGEPIHQSQGCAKSQVCTHICEHMQTYFPPPTFCVWPERGCHLSSAGVNLQTLWSTITLPEINDISLHSRPHNPPAVDQQQCVCLKGGSQWIELNRGIDTSSFKWYHMYKSVWLRLAIIFIVYLSSDYFFDSLD